MRETATVDYEYKSVNQMETATTSDPSHAQCQRSRIVRKGVLELVILIAVVVAMTIGPIYFIVAKDSSSNNQVPAVAFVAANNTEDGISVASSSSTVPIPNNTNTSNGSTNSFANGTHPTPYFNDDKDDYDIPSVNSTTAKNSNNNAAKTVAEVVNVISADTDATTATSDDNVTSSVSFTKANSTNRNTKNQTDVAATSYDVDASKAAIGNKTQDSSEPGVLIPQRTTSALSLTRGNFSFVHISKCGGAAWIHLLKALIPNFTPQIEQGDEESLPYQENENPYANIFTSLRSPRHHVWSMYAECRYDNWWGKMAFKYQYSDNTGPDEGFDQFLNLFVEAVDNKTVPLDPAVPSAYKIRNEGSQLEEINKYGCYHPANYQSRALTTMSNNPHLIDNIVGFEPDTSTAIKNLRQKVSWVGILDFFHESKCFLYYRLLSSSSPHGRNDNEGIENQVPIDPAISTAKMQQYLDNECRCPLPKKLSDVKVKHYKDEGGKRSTMLDLKQSNLDMIVALTRSDVVVFVRALKDFTKEIVWMEQESQLGRRVLCSKALLEKEPELAYLGINVTDMYYQEKQRG